MKKMPTWWDLEKAGKLLNGPAGEFVLFTLFRDGPTITIAHRDATGRLYQKRGVGREYRKFQTIDTQWSAQSMLTWKIVDRLNDGTLHIKDIPDVRTEKQWKELKQQMEGDV